MLTVEDIQKLIEAEKEVFPVKADFDELKQMFVDLQTSVDSYAKKADTYFQEMAALSNKVNRIEKWVQLLADKAGVKLEY